MAIAAGIFGEFGEPVLGILLILSLLASAPLAVFGLLAYRRRRTRPYLLVAIAFVMFLLKSVLGGVSIIGGLGTGTHHLIEHGFDFLIGSLLLGAVYLSRQTNQLDVFAFEDPDE